VNVDMLCMIVELWVLGDCDGRLVVDMEDDGGRGVKAKFKKELPQPDGFLGGMGSRDVFRLHARQGDGRLLLGALAHSCTCQLERVAGR